MSVAWVAILALILDRLPWGLRLWPIFLSELLSMLIFMAIALWCRARQPAGTAYAPEMDWRPRPWWRGLPRLEKRVYLLSAGALQLLIGATGLLLGYVEYLILRAEPLIETFTWQGFVLPAVILLISTGLLEEYIFRFLLQRTAVERLEYVLGIAYVALFFAVLHIGYRSVADFLFVLVVGLAFGWLAYKTRSIIGVTLAHGLTNIVLFLIMPFVVAGAAGSTDVEINKVCGLLDVQFAFCQSVDAERLQTDLSEPGFTEELVVPGTADQIETSSESALGQEENQYLPDRPSDDGQFAAALENESRERRSRFRVLEHGY